MNVPHPIIFKHTLETIVNYCTQQLPHEACGFLFGHWNEDQVIARRFVPVTNISPTPHHHFTMDPKEMIRSLYSAQTMNDELIGIVHSHPTAPAVLSKDDKATAWGNLYYWVVSLEHKDHPEVKVYQAFSPSSQWTAIHYTLLNND